MSKKHHSNLPHRRDHSGSWSKLWCCGSGVYLLLVVGWYHRSFVSHSAQRMNTLASQAKKSVCDGAEAIYNESLSFWQESFWSHMDKRSFGSPLGVSMSEKTSTTTVLVRHCCCHHGHYMAGFQQDSKRLLRALMVAGEESGGDFYVEQRWLTFGWHETSFTNKACKLHYWLIHFARPNIQTPLFADIGWLQ